MRRVLLFASFLLMLAGSVCAREFHVAKTGSDNNPGTAEAPFLTINRAAMELRAGDTVTVHAGVYREWVKPRNSGADTYSRIVYRAAEGEEVWIKGSEEVKGWTREKKTNVWKVVLPNSFFKDFNPFAEPLRGDWLNVFKEAYSLGEVYLNGQSLFQMESLDEVRNPVVQERTRKPEASLLQWYAEVTDTETTLWANFGGADPNKELVEVNARPAVFFPELPGVNFITVKGFHMSQAAVNWAPPTAFQPGLVGPHWSKGWVIEDNVISNSKCSGISLGKDRASGQNRWTIERELVGFNRELEAIFQAYDQGWSKENIGSHVIRNNEIFDCEQTGICGHLGAVFSLIENNYIHDINAKRQYTGAEVGCIKLHAAIDVIIRNNYLVNGYNGLWLDWQAIGTRVSSNIFENNDHTDLWTEVTHGPCLVDNNIFLSPNTFLDWGQGVCFTHNIISGYITSHPVSNRYTPYHYPHSTKVVGVMTFPGGDDRFYNNIFTVAPDSDLKTRYDGLSMYDDRPPYYPGIYRDLNTRVIDKLPQSFIDLVNSGVDAAGSTQASYFRLAMHVAGNAYYNRTKHYAYEEDFVSSGNDAKVTLERRGEEVILKMTLDGGVNDIKTRPVNTDMLGKTFYSNGYYENPDGSKLAIDKDFAGNPRSLERPSVGPFENIRPGQNEFVVWKFGE